MPSTEASTDLTQSSVHLDAIRGAAALIVFLGHTRDLYFPSLFQAQNETGTTAQTPSPQQPSDIPAAQRITIGNESVMIFFVLSGYLVGGGVIKALKRNAWSWKTYLVKRMTRLWVVLIPALLLGVMVDFAGLHLFSNAGSIYTAPPQQSVVSAVASHLSVPTIAGNFFFLQGILVTPAGTNDSLWSLANEFWYYMAFPILLLALIKNQKALLRGIYFALFVAIMYFVGRSIGLLFLIWVLGALLSVVPLTLPLRVSRVLSFAMLFLMPFVLIVVRAAPLPLYLAEWIVALFSALTIYIFLHQTQRASKGVYRMVAGFSSRISYTLYLVHLPIAVFLCACLNNPWLRWNKSPRHLAVYCAMDIGVVLLSYLFYLAFEANTDKVRIALFHRSLKERHLPTIHS